MLVCNNSTSPLLKDEVPHRINRLKLSCWQACVERSDEGGLQSIQGKGEWNSLKIQQFVCPFDSSPFFVGCRKERKLS
jgi:hypothetical protein